MVEVAANRQVPVDVSWPWPARPTGSADRSGDRSASLVRDPSFDLSDNLAHHEARRALGGVGHHVTETHQRADQMHIRLDRIEQLRLQQH